MESQLKHRLVGIAVIVSLAVIFLPYILDGAGVLDENQFEQIKVEIPSPPQVQRTHIDFNAKQSKLESDLSKIPLLDYEIIDETNKKLDAEENKKSIKTKTNGTIQKGTIKRQKVGGDSWIVQIGSFNDQEKAFKLRDKARAYKIAVVFIQKIVLNKSKTYRVRLGPFLTKKQAQSAASKIKQHKLKTIVMKHEK